MEDFINSVGIEMHAVQVPENPHMKDEHAKKMTHSHVTLTCGDNTMTTYFSVGPGIVEHEMRELPALKRAKYGVPQKPWPSTLMRSVDWQNALKRYSKAYKPGIIDVLQCLHSDFAGMYHDNFEEWASDMGYDTDSRQAEGTYNTLIKQRNEFCKLVGSQAFQKFCDMEADW